MCNDQRLNRGEWSELYAFFKILHDGFLFGCDKELNIMEEAKIKVVYIKQTQKGTQQPLIYEVDTIGDSIKITASGVALNPTIGTDNDL